VGSGDELPVVSLGAFAVNSGGLVKVVSENVPSEPARETEGEWSWEATHEECRQQKKAKLHATFNARREVVGYEQALQEDVESHALEIGNLAGMFRAGVVAMEEDNSDDEGLIAGGVGNQRRTAFDPNMPHRIELEVSDDMFAVNFHADAADGTRIEGRDIQHVDNLSSDAVAAFRASTTRGSDCGGARDDVVLSVSSSGAGASAFNAAPNFDGSPVSPHSYDALMSMEVNTGVVTDPAAPRDRGLAMAAANPDGDRKPLRKGKSLAGWATPLAGSATKARQETPKAQHKQNINCVGLTDAQAQQKQSINTQNPKLRNPNSKK
jgi:hypothetical protein